MSPTPHFIQLPAFKNSFSSGPSMLLPFATLRAPLSGPKDKCPKRTPSETVSASTQTPAPHCLPLRTKDSPKFLQAWTRLPTTFPIHFHPHLAMAYTPAFPPLPQCPAAKLFSAPPPWLLQCHRAVPLDLPYDCGNQSPSNSTWDVAALSQFCTSENEHIIIQWLSKCGLQTSGVPQNIFRELLRSEITILCILRYY